MHPDTDPDVLPVDVAENDAAAQDGHDDDHKEEAGAAAGMMLGLDAGVFHRQGQARLIAENGLVFGTVVAEHPAHILLLGAEDQIGQKDGHLDDALNEIVEGGVLSAEQPGHEGGQQHEQRQRHAQRQQHRHPYQHVLELFCRNVLFQPQVQLGGLGGLVVGEVVRREHQGLDAPDHGVQKGHGPPQDGKAQNGVFVLDKCQLLHLGHKALRGAHHNGLLFRATHEDALNESLSADGGAECAGFVFHRRCKFLSVSIALARMKCNNCSISINAPCGAEWAG